MERMTHPSVAAGKHNRASQVDKAGWGIALIWVGAAILIDIEWEWGLLGLGAIILGCQLVRRALTLALDWFAVALGICLCLIGLEPLLGSALGGANLIPILSIALGGAFLVSAALRRRAS